MVNETFVPTTSPTATASPTLQPTVSPTTSPVPLAVPSNCFNVDPPSSAPSDDAESLQYRDKFFLVTTQQPYVEGSSLCSSLVNGALPASIRSSSEMETAINHYFDTVPVIGSEIASGFLRSPGYFMGLIDPNITDLNDPHSVEGFHWVDGSPLTFGNVSGEYPWHDGEPNNSRGKAHEGCLEFRRDTKEWNDRDCGASRMIMCRVACSPIQLASNSTKAPTNHVPNESTVPIAVGVSLGLIGLVFLAAIFGMRRKRARKAESFDLFIDLPPIKMDNDESARGYNSPPIGAIIIGSPRKAKLQEEDRLPLPRTAVPSGVKPPRGPMPLTYSLDTSSVITVPRVRSNETDYEPRLPARRKQIPSLMGFASVISSWRLTSGAPPLPARPFSSDGDLDTLASVE